MVTSCPRIGQKGIDVLNRSRLLVSRRLLPECGMASDETDETFDETSDRIELHPSTLCYSFPQFGPGFLGDSASDGPPLVSCPRRMKAPISRLVKEGSTNAKVYRECSPENRRRSVLSDPCSEHDKLRRFHYLCPPSVSGPRRSFPLLPSVSASSSPFSPFV